MNTDPLRRNVFSRLYDVFSLTGRLFRNFFHYVFYGAFYGIFHGVSALRGAASSAARTAAAITAGAALCVLLSGCGPAPVQSPPNHEPTGRYLVIMGDKEDTVDFQCTSAFYTVALNVFDRLVEVQANPDGSSEIVPSLADSWSISDDGLVYTFHLHPDVCFSNGSPLTSSDVLYTFNRLLTHPNAVNRDLIVEIAGAEQLQQGRSASLEGFHYMDDHTFSLRLEKPYAAFLACLSTPGASILDEETVRAARDRFGRDPAWTIGTGPFIFQDWIPGERMTLAANPLCWSGPPKCAGITTLTVADPETQRLLFERGELDILDLDNMGSEAEYFLHGDIYRDQLISGPRVGISYIALNASIPPLDSGKVRKALQLGLNRQILLDAVYSGRGAVENGIFPHGLIGYNPDLPAIPYDPEEAVRLLAEAGFPDGFPLTISLSGDATGPTRELLTLVAAMWQRIGVQCRLDEIEESQFTALRKAQKLACYSSTWSADFNDPDNFIYTFFGTEENTGARSLCYGDGAVMARVRNARSIVDTEARIRAYQDLERKIIQEDAAWIPLFSKQHYFIVNPDVEGFQVSWNGWSSTSYRNVSIRETPVRQLSR